MNSSGTESHAEDNSGRLVDSEVWILPIKANSHNETIWLYNIRTISASERQEHLEKELEDIEWNILGLA